MQITKKASNLKGRWQSLKYRLTRQCKKICAVIISASLIIGGFPSVFFQALAADDYGEYEYEFERVSIYEALNDAVEMGTTLDNELVFLGDHAEEYDELFRPDGTLYELKNIEPNEDAERDKESGLRVFVRLEGDIDLDEAYKVDGTEEVLFLFTNKTDTDNYVKIIIDDGETEYIKIPSAKDIPVDISENLAITLSPLEGAASGAASATATGDIIIEEDSSDETRDADENTSTFKDSEVSIEDADAENDSAAGSEKAADSEEFSDEGSEEVSPALDDSEGKDDSDDPADDSKDEESGEKPDEGKDSGSDRDTSSGDTSDKADAGDSSNDKDISDKDSSGDKDASDKDSSDSKDSSDGKTASDENGSSSDSKDSASDKASSDKDAGDKDSATEKSASISINKNQLLAAAIASASDAEAASSSDASPSDASHIIEGTVYDPVRLGRWGAVAFAATTADLGLDEYDSVFSIVYEGEDYTVTVEYDGKAALPNDVTLSGEEYDKDSDTFIERYEEAKELYGWEDDKEPAARLFDVTLLSGEEEVEPATAVDVTFTFLNDKDNESEIAFLSADDEDDEDETFDDPEDMADSGYKGHKYTITHFGEDEIETLDSDVISEAGGRSITFTLESFSDIMVIDDDETASGEVVLNLGNGDGNYNFADYTGSKAAGKLLRYTTDSLAAYADNNGKLIINLPSDKDLPTENDQTKSFTVVNASNDLEDVTVDLNKELAYDYTLVGWVNIATGKYYDVSKGAATAEIDLNNENVFYADWIAASYDNYDSSTSGSLRTDTVSTDGFVTIKMFDYNDLFNLYSTSVEQNGTTSETWSDSGFLHSTLLGDKDTEIEYKDKNGVTQNVGSFVFTNDGTAATVKGMLQNLKGRTPGNTWTGTPEDEDKSYVIDAASTWGVYSPGDPYYDEPGDTILGFLFNEKNAQNIAGVNYVGDADGLFWLDKNGYYTYDSAESAACYNQSDGKFYVYNAPQYINGKSRACFLPYNSYKSSKDYGTSNGLIDYWFGMSMEVDFYLPSATGTIGSDGNYGNKVNGEDMVFNFSGDDDIMIFVDDELVLDMSGIHDLSYGSINFSTGETIIGMSRDSSGVIDTKYGSTDKVSIKSGNHSLIVYYLERGGYESNLEIQFNVVPLWDYDVGAVQTIVAEKIWTDSVGNPIDPNEVPDTFTANGVKVGLFDVLSNTSDSTGYTKDSNDNYIFEYTDDNENYYKFVYNASVPSLTFTMNNEDSIVYNAKDSEGRVLDTDGNIVAWLNNDLLYIRMDIQTLSNSNNWYYAWELLDPDGEYEVLELSGSSSYITKSDSEDLITYLYWSVIGDKEIEDGILDGEHPVILTEAAQEAGNTLGSTKEALGWVIVGAENGIETEQVKFSQIATLEEKKNADGIVTSYLGTYGVTSQSEINSLGDGALWYMVDANKQEEGVDGEIVEGFYFHCELKGTNYYLTLTDDEHGLTLTTSEEKEREFYYDALGELMVVLSDSEHVRVEILEDGTINIGEAEFIAAADDVRIYTLQETKTSGFAFTAVNTLLPDITLEKVDSSNPANILEGVSFTLTNDAGLYYTGLDDNDEVIWQNNITGFNTDSNGQIVYHYMADGTYILTESSTLDGYHILPCAVQIKIETTVVEDESKINITVSWDSEDTAGLPNINNFVTVSDEGLIITIINEIGTEFPNTGGSGTMPFTLTGALLMGGSTMLYLLLKRRRLKI